MAQYCPPYPHIHRDQSNLQYRGELLDDYVYNVDRELINPNLLRPGSRYRFLRLHCYRVPTHDDDPSLSVERRCLYIKRPVPVGSTRYGIVRKSAEILSFRIEANGSVAGADFSARMDMHVAFIFRPDFMQGHLHSSVAYGISSLDGTTHNAKTDPDFLHRNILFRNRVSHLIALLCQQNLQKICT